MGTVKLTVICQLYADISRLELSLMHLFAVEEFEGPLCNVGKATGKKFFIPELVNFVGSHVLEVWEYLKCETDAEDPSHSREFFGSLIAYLSYCLQPCCDEFFERCFSLVNAGMCFGLLLQKMLLCPIVEQRITAERLMGTPVLGSTKIQ